MPYESFPPFAIIVGAITAMGGVHYAVQMLYEGKPKPVGQDNFDRLMKYRDERVRAEAKVRDDSLGSTERRRPPVAPRREAVGGQI
jgi:NADH dehydrogenase (ubiquinone) 1 alpha subcomplex subunit 1